MLSIKSPIMKKTEKPVEGPAKKAPPSQNKGRHAEIKTDAPLSEKDEVKQAEDKMRKAVKKGH
jgi:hypothetical protein